MGIHIQRLIGTAFVVLSLLLAGAFNGSQASPASQVADVAAWNGGVTVTANEAAPCAKFVAPQSRNQGCKRGGVPFAGTTRFREESILVQRSTAVPVDVAFDRAAPGTAYAPRAVGVALTRRARGAPFWDSFLWTSSLLY